MKQIDISRRVFVLVVVVGVLGLTGWLTHSKAIPETITTSILITLVATLPALINAMAGVKTDASNGNGTSSPTATTIPPKSGGGSNAVLALTLPLPALLLGGLLSCTAAQTEAVKTGLARTLTMTVADCIQEALSVGRKDLAEACARDGLENAAEVVRAAAVPVCTMPDAGADQ